MWQQCVLLASCLALTGAVWRPGQTTSFQWQLNSGHINTHVNAHVYDVDLFDVSTSTIHSLQK